MNFINSINLSLVIKSFLAFAMLLNFNMAGAQETYNLELQFTNLEPKSESVVLIAVYNKTDGFLGDNPYKDFAAKTNGKDEFTHTLQLPEGTYALAFFQDLNGNKKLDKNMIGYPTEPFAFSNNAPANFGPPKWKDAVFKLESDEKMKIDF